MLAKHRGTKEVSDVMSAVVGRVIGGSAGSKIQIRVKSDSRVDIGDILIVEDSLDNEKVKYYIKVVNVGINSLLPGQFIDDIAGQKLEHDSEMNLFDEKDRFYKICEAKTLKVFMEGKDYPGRNIPNYFSEVRRAESSEFPFLNSVGGVNIGSLRLGMRVLNDVSIRIPADKLVTHHVLVSAATGKGKSNFAKVFIKGILDLDSISALIMDPHNEYYGGKDVKGLRDLRSNKVVYFTPKPGNYPGSETLKIYGEDLTPSDFFEVLDASTAQGEAMELAYRLYQKKWLKELLINKNINEIEQDMQSKVQRVTIASLKRKLQHVLDLRGEEPEGLIFSLKDKEETSIFDKIKRNVNDVKVIIIDTSLVGDIVERIIASSISRKLFHLYRETKQIAPDKFRTLPELMILFEEAPRFLGREVLERGSNVFARIAREGRKFKVGLCAITQMPSLLPPEILSQMNTKVILGIPSPIDRQAVINSSAQDINDENVEIQMLDTGEALITSPFIKFPLPVKVHDFNSLVTKETRKNVNIGVS